MLATGEIVSAMFPRMARDAGPWTPRGFMLSDKKAGPFKDESPAVFRLVREKRANEMATAALAGTRAPARGTNATRRGEGETPGDDDQEVAASPVLTGLGLQVRS